MCNGKVRAPTPGPTTGSWRSVSPQAEGGPGQDERATTPSGEQHVGKPILLRPIMRPTAPPSLPADSEAADTGTQPMAIDENDKRQLLDLSTLDLTPSARDR